MKNKLMCAVLAACLLTSLLAAPVCASEAGEMTDPAAVLTEEGGTETVEETAGVETEEEQDAEDIEEAGEEIPPEEDVQEETVTDVPEVTETPEESTQTPAAQPPKKTSTKAEQEPEDVEEADPEEELREAAHADITYQVHQQTFGWLPWVANGEEAGVTGLSKRMEAILIELEDQTVDGSVEYRTHVQTYGWQNWVRDGQMAGTSGEAKRLEAIQIRLTGQMAQEFDIWYRVHCQTFGWMGWAKNGAQAGSAGYAKRLEAIEIRLVEKGGPAPGSTANAFQSAEKDAAGAGTSGTGIEYRTHVQTYGWLDYVRNGEASGTTGESKRLEGINIRLTDPETSGGVQYRTHVQTISK